MIHIAIEKCLPEISFSRVDNEGDGVVSTGFNFRSVYYENNSTLRELKKLYGLRLVFISSGRAGKFHIVPLCITLGSGLAYLGLATIVVDFVLSRCIKNHQIYKQKKYAVIDEPLIKQIATKIENGQVHEIQMSADEATLAAHIHTDTNGHANGHKNGNTINSHPTSPVTPHTPNENENIIRKNIP